MEQDMNMETYTIVQDHSHKTSSCVWKYFGSLKKNEELVDIKHVYCTKCFDESKTKKYQKSTSTGNLIKHLKKAHNIMDQPSYRIKHEKDVMIVTKEDSYYEDEGETDYYLNNQSSNYIPLATSSQDHSIKQNESETHEYLVNDINEILISEISKRPQIYDASICTKNKTQIRRDLWNEIYEALNQLIPYERLPKIWKNIRDRYQKIKKDMEKDGRSNVKPKYRYYEMLRFLDDVENHHSNSTIEEKLNVPIDNFVSNFIFLNGNEQQEDADMSQLDPITIQELADVKQEIFCGETKIKKRKLENVHHQVHEEEEQEPQSHHAPHLHSHHHEELEIHHEQQQQQLHETISAEHKSADDVIHEADDDETEIIVHQQQQESTPRVTSLTTLHSVASPTTVWIEAPSAAGPAVPATFEHKQQKQTGEFVIFGSYVAEVMKNMEKTKARMLQMKVLQLITEYDAAN